MARHHVGIGFVFALFVVSFLFMPNVALADGHLPPVPVTGPRVSPPPIPHSGTINPFIIWNNLLNPPPVQSLEGDATELAKQGEGEGHGRGVRQTMTGLGAGATLYAQGEVCNDFNTDGLWARSANQNMTDQYTNWYAGWAPFAVDHGLYQAKNTVFQLERFVGPGNKIGPGQFSAKISSYQPYAGGYGSPKLAVKPGAKVTVTVSYLIYDHDNTEIDYDWASMGLKPDAAGEVAEYVNGYVRGEWAQMTHSIKAGKSGEIMVMIQGQSPAAVNSNIYFDNVKIWVDGVALKDCTLE